MRRTLSLLAAVLLAGDVLPRAHAAEPDAALQQLLDNAEYWRQRGRMDKVVETYEKILRADPNHATALAELSVYYAQEGQADKAKSYLERLARAHPNDPRVSSARQAQRVGGDFKDRLAEARRLAQAGQTAAAVARYREVFGSATPTGAAALEFYQTLGGLEEGWEEARRGLERLAKESPGNTAVSLALGQHLTYRESTRREGIARLTKLADDTNVGLGARRGWRQALMWLKASPADSGLFRAWLTREPGDNEVKARLDRLASTGDAGPGLDVAYRALDAADVETADEVFSWALKQRGRNVDALVGMAIVEMRRENFPAAEKLLEEASKVAPQSPEKWEAPLRSARFWRILREAEAAQAARDWEKAGVLLQTALETSPEDAIHAEMALGNLYVAVGQEEKGEEMFARVLERDPNHLGALTAMTQQMLRNGQLEAAVVFNERSRRLGDPKALSDARMRSEALRHQAGLQIDLGDVSYGLDLLEQANVADPTNEWALFDLVNLRLERGEIEVARGVMDRLLSSHGNLTQVGLVNARLLAEEGRYAEALAALRARPDDTLDDDTRVLKRRIEVQVEGAIAVRKATVDGDLQTARRELFALQERVATQPDLLAVVAMSWSEMGDQPRALQVVREAVEASPDRSTSIRLQQAAILLRAQQDDELVAVLEELKRDTRLSARERRGLANLRIAHAVDQADRARDQGLTTFASDLLQPLLTEYPEDPRLVTALGRVLYSARDYEGAAAVFMKVLGDRPDDLDARQGAVLTAIAAGRRDEARRILDEGLALRPDDPRMHLVAGRVAAMNGQDGKAVKSFKEALRYEDARNASTGDALRRLASRNAGSNVAPDPSLSYEQLVRASAARLKAAAGGQRPETNTDPTLHGEIVREIRAVDDRHRYRVGARVDVRHRAGEAGMSGITELKIPVSADIPTGYVGQIEIQAAPTYLFTGIYDQANPEVVDRVGSLAVNGRAFDPVTDVFGAELKLGWSWQSQRIWVGSTPIGFLLPTVVGGVQVGHRWGAFGFRLDAQRSAVTDSVLSWAGQRDPGSGEVWGGVTRNGARLDLAYDKKPLVFYLYGGFHGLLGTQVRTNTQWEGGLGLRWALVRREAITWEIGLTANLFGYATNDRFFSLGHGGYFSPQTFINAGVPLVLSGETPKIRYLVDVNLGLNWFREDAAAFYPLRPGLQAVQDRYYEARTRLSFALSAGGTVGFKISDRLTPGIQAYVHTAAEFTEVAVGVRLDYAFGRGSTLPTGATPR